MLNLVTTSLTICHGDETNPSICASTAAADGGLWWDEEEAGWQQRTQIDSICPATTAIYINEDDAEENRDRTGQQKNSNDPPFSGLFFRVLEFPRHAINALIDY